VDNVFFIFSTRARKELDGGAACSFAGTALKLPRMPNGNETLKSLIGDNHRSLCGAHRRQGYAS
jgi:hypothetical protein